MVATQESLIADLKNLGVCTGDTLFIHSSFKSLGTVEGGAANVVAALEAAVGETGTIAMPSFNLCSPDTAIRAESWDIKQTPSTVGWLTEYFRQLPGTVRSDHYSHSVAVRGRDAEWLVSGHLSHTGVASPWDREPWGRTYGDDSPMIRIMARLQAKLLMLGVDYKTSTYIHVVECLDWHQRLQHDPDAPFYSYQPREKVGAYWEGVKTIEPHLVGQAECRLFGIKEYVETLLAEIGRAPEVYCRWHPDYVAE